jgi:hypothetical protein
MNPAAFKTLLTEAIENGEHPRYLYKYRAIDDNTLKSIRNSEYWFAQPKMFNDPFDCNLSEILNHSLEDFKNYLAYQNNKSGMTEKEYKTHIKNFKKNPKWARNLAINARENAMNEHGVFSLSQESKNILMWSHYGDQHKGIVLKFDILADTEFFSTPIKINYVEKYDELNYYSTQDRLNSLSRNISTKSTLWSYEKEYRILKSENGLHKVNKISLCEVIFGCKTPPTKLKEVKSLIKKSGYENVSFSKATIDHGQFSLSVRKA